MKVILNSDITHHQYLVTEGLGEGLQQLFKVCLASKHTILVPLTVLLEFQRKQSEFAEAKINQLQNACDLLDRFGIAHAAVRLSDVVRPPDLIDLIRKSGVDVIVENPTMDDLSEAHRRACLHESPHPPDTKSDEMRDLVIWMIALRIASHEGSAMLISRDTVHSHDRGHSEASLAGLVRVKTVDEALEYFEIANPARKLVEQLLRDLWNEAAQAGLPVGRDLAVVSVSEARFIQGIRGLSQASCHLKVKALEGKTLEADTEMHIEDGRATEVSFSKIVIDDERWKDSPVVIRPNKAVTLPKDDYDERFKALKELLGE